MGMSGLIGGEAVKGLEDLIAQQLEEAQMAEQVRRAKEAEAMQRRRASQDDTRIDLDRRQLEQGERARRDASNRFGVEQMFRDKDAMDREAEAARRANVVSSLSTIKGLSPVQRMAAEENIRAGRGVNPDDFRTPDQLRADEDNRIRFEGRLSAARRGPDKPDQPKEEWLVRNGDVIKGVYQPGDTPYDRSRQTERPVLSSDANRIAELDNSLALLDGLEGGIGATGAMSFLKAQTPSIITDMTGLGADEKSRQALIDQTKQIIGKAMEGGVLRKEDEAKYVKILPTLTDHPDVVKAKVANLRQSLLAQRETTLESLGAAGYNVAALRQRAPKNTLTKTQTNTRTGEKRTLVSMDGGKTWQVRQ